MAVNFYSETHFADNVGIGTTSPVEALNVGNNGNIRIDGNGSGRGIFASSNGSNNTFSFTRQDGVNTADLSISGYGGVGITGGRTSSPATSGYSLYVKNSGNVGIGTTSPAFKTTIYSSGTTDSFPLVVGQGNAANNFVGIGLSGFIASNGAVKAAMVLDRDGVYGVGDIHFLNNTTEDNTNATLSDSRLVIKKSGNVGIGTSSPGGKLHVKAGTAGTYNPNASHDDITIEGSGNVGLQLFSPNSTYQYIAFGDPDSVNAGYIRYHHGSNTMVLRTNGQDRVNINSSGNVGIGTDSPNARLHVNGEFIVAEDSEKGLDINTQTYNYKIGDIDAGESQTYIEVDSVNAKTTLHNSTLELGHASDTTIARASAGKVTIEGQPIQTKQMSMTHHNFFMNSSSTSADFFIPFNNLNESSNPTNSIYYGRMVAPYDGRIVKVVLNTTAAIGTSCQVLFWIANSISGVFAPSASETVTGVNLNTANSHAVATFSTNSTAEFNEGDVLGVSIIKSSSSTANMQVTVVWEYTV